MTDFKEAFKRGLNNHDAAERAKAQIASVFNDFISQIDQASGGAIKVSRERKSKEVESKKTFVDVITGVLPEYRSYNALVARPSDIPNPKSFELCEYEISPDGYPVTITYEDTENRCYDKSSLEAGLSNVLEHPNTGGKLKELLSTAAKPS